MRLSIYLMAGLLAFGLASDVLARGFGGARAGGYRAGGAAVGPYGGARAGTARGGAYAGPYSAGAAGARSGTYVGPRGTTVQGGQAGGVYRGPAGGVHAGGVQGARVTTPGGQTYTTGSHGRAGVGPAGGVYAHGGRGAAVNGPYGGAAVRQGGGVVAGPYGGVAAGGYRGGAAVRGGGYGVGHSTRYIGSSTLRGTAGYVRTGYNGYGYTCFTPGWYGVHTGAWTAARWRTANYWVAPAWSSVATFCGVDATTPYAYDYGSGIVIEDNTVYVGGDSRGSAEDYAQNALDLSDTGRKAKPDDKDEWQGLGVFGMVQGENEKVAQNIFQLAINKEGVVRGNYYDAVADTTQPVYGSLNRKTQKVAWSIGEKKTVVFEAGLNNLTKNETTILVHYGKERTQQMVLVRLEQSKDEKK